MSNDNMPFGISPPSQLRILVLVAELKKLFKIYDYAFAADSAKQISPREIESEVAAPLRQESGTSVPSAHDVLGRCRGRG